MFFRRLWKYLRRKLAGEFRVLFKNGVNAILFWKGVKVLSKDQTRQFLEPHIIKKIDPNEVPLPSVKNFSSQHAELFKEKKAVSESAFVWLIDQSKNARQLRHGGVLISSKVLCTDFNQVGFYHSILFRGERTKTREEIIIAPWTQYSDGFTFGGYYDFLILVAGKLARIKEAVPPQLFLEACISYPIFGTRYESEILELLDVDISKIRDSRKVLVLPEKIILANSGHWVYPNIADIFALKRFVEEKLSAKKKNSDRIYISRSSRRRIINEWELIDLLREFNFTVIEDIERSVTEQVRIFKNASFIIGPHGASFSNIIWCDPGTHLVELFSPNYAPDHFLYLANILKLKYSAYSYGSRKKNLPLRQALPEDIYVSIPEIRTYLVEILGDELAGTKINVPIVNSPAFRDNK